MKIKYVKNCDRCVAFIQNLKEAIVTRNSKSNICDYDPILMVQQLLEYHYQT